MSIRVRRSISGRKVPETTGTSRDYEQTWYCLRLGGRDKFPDGRPVPVQKWKTLKPIWIRIGKGASWAKAITFGPAKETMEEAAEDFGAKRIVWLNKKTKNAVPEKSQDTRSE